MILLEPYKQLEDPRGSFLGIVNTGRWEELNYIETDAGQTRGGHYHQATQELFFILEGEIEIQIGTLDGIITHVFSARKGHIFIVEPLEIHSFKCLTPSKWINVLSRKMDDKTMDFNRINF
jgi:mannose-6-phosphate isomerase-like protein (cupin superfamily)